MIRFIPEPEQACMTTELPLRRRIQALFLAGTAAWVLGTGSAGAQAPPPGGPPPEGPPPGALAQLGPPRAPPLTPVEKLVTELPPPMPGGGPPVPPLAPGAPMPSSDPHDLQGTWIHGQKLEFRMQRDMYGALVPYTLAGAKVLARRVNSLTNGTPFINASARCRPTGPQWQRDLNMPFQIFQSPDWIEFVFQEYHGRWQVVLNPAKAPPPTPKNYMGYSVAHWDGSTLVVESSDFRQAIWLDVDGTPLSANGKLIQRIRKVDNGEHAPFLEVISTIVDPAYYSRPWSVVRLFAWQPGLTVFDEYNCEEQIGDPTVSSDAGLVPEPQD
jgi:hypothetical protein